MVHLDLFSGIGGFAFAADWVWPGIQHIFCEIESFPQKVLKKHWPGAPIYSDIKELNGYEIKKKYGTIDILTGGFPCQPFSVAGKQRGQADNRYLWPEMLRIIEETRPRWIIGENVTGIINLALDEVLALLESAEYDFPRDIEGKPVVFCIPACAVNAPHRRDRVWIIAYDAKQINGKVITESNKRQIQQSGIGFEQTDVADTTGKRRSIQRNGLQKSKIITKRSENVSDTDKFNGNDSGFRTGKISQQQTTKICNIISDAQKPGLERTDPEGATFTGRRDLQCFSGDWWAIEPGVGRVAHGIPHRMDRLKCLGNAIVPQIAAEIMRCIKEIDRF